MIVQQHSSADVTDWTLSFKHGFYFPHHFQVRFSPPPALQSFGMCFLLRSAQGLRVHPVRAGERGKDCDRCGCRWILGLVIVLHSILGFQCCIFSLSTGCSLLLTLSVAVVLAFPRGKPSPPEVVSARWSPRMAWLSHCKG